MDLFTPMNQTFRKNPIKQRWAFSEEESALPFACNGFDELIAPVTVYDDDGKIVTEHAVIVCRNGWVCNRFGDGTVGVSSEIAELADGVETLLHPDGKETEVWKDVEADKDGNFIRFLD